MVLVPVFLFALLHAQNYTTKILDVGFDSQKLVSTLFHPFMSELNALNISDACRLLVQALSCSCAICWANWHSIKCIYCVSLHAMKFSSCPPLSSWFSRESAWSCLMSISHLLLNPPNTTCHYQAEAKTVSLVSQSDSVCAISPRHIVQ